MPVTVTENTYDEVVVKSAKPVLLDLWAPWCGPCIAMEPRLRELEAAFDDQIIVAKINVDNEPGLTSRLGVMALPTLRILHNGRTQFEAVGAINQSKLAAAIGTALREKLTNEA